MNREFLEQYNTEIKLLKERAKLFADEYPGIADRLGGLAEDRLDPGIQGLLEGCAFLAARVQMKLRSEFRQFTAALLDQVLPSFLAPIPSLALVRVRPPLADPDLVRGLRFPEGSLIDAVYAARDSRINCRYRLTDEIAVWPLEVVQASYLPSAAGLGALGLECLPGTVAGLHLAFELRAPGDEAGMVADCPVDSLPIHLSGPTADMVALYEQLFANLGRVSIRHVGPFGKAVFHALPPAGLSQIGFDAPGSVFGADDRVFPGFELLRDFFAFPQKYLGFRLGGLAAVLPKLPGNRFEVVVEFTRAVPRLAPVVRPDNFVLFAAPAVNLFEKTCSRTTLRPNEHEHHVVADRSRPLDYEINRIIDVQAHYAGHRRRVKVLPLYGAPEPGTPVEEALYYTSRRRRRDRTVDERQFGAVSDYLGGEVFLTLSEPARVDEDARARDLTIRVLASNRHLPAMLPVGSGRADFTFVSNTAIELECVGAPTLPRAALTEREETRHEGQPGGRPLWVLINLLSLNHLALTEESPEEGASRLRTLLGLFAELADVSAERRIQGLVSVSSRPVVRRVRQRDGFNIARGIEVTVTLDDPAFEGSGAFLLGAALDRFFADYASINSFTQTVIRTRQRGEIARWPPRAGFGRLL